jgi:uncharacterized protein (TIGR03435 family)
LPTLAPPHLTESHQSPFEENLKYYQSRAGDRKDDETNPWSPLETAIQEQLGLKLQSTSAPTEYLVR